MTWIEIVSLFEPCQVQNVSWLETYIEILGVEFTMFGEIKVFLGHENSLTE